MTSGALTKPSVVWMSVGNPGRQECHAHGTPVLFTGSLAMTRPHALTSIPAMTSLPQEAAVRYLPDLLWPIP
ncbi:hypothetical protein ACOMHN_009891 [Nucella lapillus]